LAGRKEPNAIETRIEQSTIDSEAKKVLQALGRTLPNDAEQTAIDPVAVAEQKRQQLISAKAECDDWTLKLATENSAGNRMSKNLACQKVSQFMNQIESSQIMVKDK